MYPSRACSPHRLLACIKFSWNVNLLQCLELSLGASGLRFVTDSNLPHARNAVRLCCCTKSKPNQSV